MDLYKTFERYLFNDLTAEERDQFELRLEQDKDFKSEFEIHKQTQLALDVLVEEDVLKQIDTLKNPESTTHLSAIKPVDTKGSKSKFWLMAAALLLLFSTFLIFNLNSKKEPSFMVEYSAPIDVSSTRSNETEEVQTDYYRATQAAHDLIAQKNYKKAAEKFEKHLAEFEGLEKQEIEWYLALVVSEFDMERSRNLLYTISNTKGHPYMRKAKALLIN